MGFGTGPTVAQVTNIAPTVTGEQLRTLLSFVGTIREFVVYPSNDPSEQLARVCYVRFLDPTSVLVAQHLTNTVFIDRAIFVKPVTDNKIPDECLALKLANEGHSQNSSNSGVVSQIANVNGTQSITTIDPRLNALGLPQYPPLPANLDPSKIEEIRRTVTVMNISLKTSPEEILQFFNQFGEVKYLRMTSNEGEIIKAALIEFTDQSSVANALQNSGTMLNGAQLSINHSSNSILKPQHSLAEIEKSFEPKPRIKESPVIRRSRSPSRKSRSPVRSSRRRSTSRSRSREHRRRSRSRERRRSVEKRRSRSRSYSKDRGRERSRRGSDRSTKDRDRRDRSKDRSIERNRDRERKRSHDRDRDRRRDHSRERRSKDHDRERGRRKERERSRESDRKERHRSRRDKERGRSRSRSKSKNAHEKREIPDLPFEGTKRPEMVDDKKNEPDDLSVKSEEGNSSHKSISPWRSTKHLKSTRDEDKKSVMEVDSEG